MATAPLGGPVLQWVKGSDNEPVYNFATVRNQNAGNRFLN
jgi:hypothetical protein